MLPQRLTNKDYRKTPSQRLQLYLMKNDLLHRFIYIQVLIWDYVIHMTSNLYVFINGVSRCLLNYVSSRPIDRFLSCKGK